MTTRRWLPDPAAGRRLRALAIGLVIACAATCALGRAPSGHAAARRIVAIGAPVTARE